MVEYDEALAKATERTYLMPEIVKQRSMTIQALHLRIGEKVLDVGCGPGLLAQDMALAVGENGRIHGIDNSAPMIRMATERCAPYPQVTFAEQSATDITEEENSYDVVTCTQVLLYVDDPQSAVNSMYRTLKPGGRIAVIETDWRGVVFNSSDHTLTRRLLDHWESQLPSPNLPSKMQGMLRQAGFSAVGVQAIPIIETSFHPDNYSGGMVSSPRRDFVEQGIITQAESDAYGAYLQEQSDAGNYFFSINRFLFTAVK